MVRYIFLLIFFGIALLTFSGIVSCDLPLSPKKRGVKSHSSKLSVSPKPTGNAQIFNFLDQEIEKSKKRNLLKQNGSKLNGNKIDPKLLRLPNMKQMNILMRRLARLGDARKRLLKMGDNAVPYLSYALLNPKTYNLIIIRRECALLLGEIKNNSSIKYLIQAMTYDPDMFVKLACIDSLTKFRTASAIEPMRERFFASGSSVFIRSALAIALAEVGDKTMIPHFKKLSANKPSNRRPHRYSKKRYFIWHIKQALKILTGSRNDFHSPPFRGRGAFSHTQKTR